MIKELNILIGTLIFLGSLNSTYVKALPYIDDGYMANEVTKILTNRIPTADDIAEIWIQSNLNQTMTNGDRNRYDIFENGQTKILRNSFRIKENWLVKKYCIVSNVSKNCMEVGLNPKNESNTPMKIRLRANLMRKKRARGTEDEREKIVSNFIEFSEVEEESYEDDDGMYRYDDSDDDNLGFREIAETYDKHDAFDENKLVVDSEQSINLRDRRKKRSLMNKQMDGFYKGEVKGRIDFFKGKKKKDKLDINTRVKRDEDDDVYEMEEDYEEFFDSQNSSGPSDEYSLGSSDDVNSDLSSNDYLGPSEKKDSSDSSNVQHENPFMNSNPSNSFKGSIIKGSNENSQYLWYNCRLPDQVSNAEMMCTKWRDAVSCNLYCAHGHKFDEGIMRTTSCHVQNGQWTSKFSQCEPFIDCTLQLVSAGTLSCSTHHVKKGTTCDVSCEGNGKKDDTKIRKYACGEHGTWTPRLPHCVRNEGIDVVKPPSEHDDMLHGEIDYPKKYPF